MRYFGVIAILCISIVSCTENDPSKNNNNNDDDKKRYPVAVLNITNAQTVAVLDAGSGRVAAEASNFYKITTANTMEEVTFVNADGSALSPDIKPPVVSVTNVINLDSKFVLLNGTFTAWDTLGGVQNYTTLLVRKTDGAIFNFVDYNVNPQKVKLGDDLIKHDGAGNIYYPNFTGGITKLSVSDPEKVTKEEYLPTGQSAQFFEITSNGSAMYKYGDGSGVTNANGTDQIRIKKPSGGIFEVKVDGRDNRQFWMGVNGAPYLITYTWSNGYLPAIHKITIDGENISLNQVWSDDTYTYPGVGNMLRTNSQGTYKINKEHSVVFIDTYFHGADETRSWEFNEETNTVTNIELPQIEEGAIIVASSDHYYIATGTSFYKVDLDNHEYVDLLAPGDYQIYSMNVDAHNKVQFSGLRLSDGKKVFAEIAAGGTFVVLDQEIGKTATVLERLD